jgi:hypothetical protein
VRRSVVALALVLCAAAAPRAQETTGADSLDRVRARLQKPEPALKLEPPTPDFRVHIEKRRPMQDIFDVPPWATDPVGWQPPALGFDLLSVFRSAARSVAEAKHGHDVRLAREEVQRAIADYCAVQQPNDDGRTAQTQICAMSPAIR